jgi:hypothetical protein
LKHEPQLDGSHSDAFDLPSAEIKIEHPNTLTGPRDLAPSCPGELDASRSPHALNLPDPVRILLDFISLLPSGFIFDKVRMNAVGAKFCRQSALFSVRMDSILFLISKNNSTEGRGDENDSTQRSWTTPEILKGSISFSNSLNEWLLLGLDVLDARPGE